MRRSDTGEGGRNDSSGEDQKNCEEGVGLPLRTAFMRIYVNVRHDLGTVTSGLSGNSNPSRTALEPQHLVQDKKRNHQGTQERADR
jgi:hypothetical protein